MDILYYPQCSMYDKLRGGFLPQADGNVNMARNFINEWLKHRPEDNFFIILPKAEGFYDYRIFHEEIKIDATPLYIEEFVVSARINRFNFPTKDIKRVLEKVGIRPKLVITDVIELARNFRALFNVEFGYNPKIISNIRHVDEIGDERNMEYDYTLRVVDGILASDYTTILSYSMKDLLLKNLLSLLDADLITEIHDRVEVFEPSISWKELDQYKQTYIADPHNKIITFPGRLNKGEERRTNWDVFQHAIMKLRQERQDFTVYLTDPNNSMTEELKESLITWVRTIDKDREQFLTLLNQTSVIVSLMNIQGFGGISIREGLLMGNTPVIPYNQEYIRMAPSNHKGFIKGEITIDKLVDAMNWALDNYVDLSNYAMQFSIETQMKDLITKIGVILNEQ